MPIAPRALRSEDSRRTDGGHFLRPSDLRDFRAMPPGLAGIHSSGSPPLRRPPTTLWYSRWKVGFSEYPAFAYCCTDVRDQDRRELSGLVHSSGSPALRRPSNTAGRFGVCSIIHLTVIAGLRRRASAKAAFASSISPTIKRTIVDECDLLVSISPAIRSPGSVKNPRTIEAGSVLWGKCQARILLRTLLGLWLGRNHVSSAIS